MNARAEILDRIRRATAGAPAPDPVPREYERAPSTGPGDVEKFAHAVDEYRATVIRVAHADIAAAIGERLAHGATVVAPEDLPHSWIPSSVTVRADPGLTVSDLDDADAVVTGCAVAIAMTGTIVLDAGVAQGRRALTLVPDHHICVVFDTDIVDTVPQAFAALDPRRPLTFVSGPSATSDIELSRVEGVHGPRILDVLIVSG